MLRLRDSFLPLALAAFGLCGTAAAQDSFRFEPAPDKVQSGHWRVAGLPRKYFGELLPALFERTLALDAFDAREAALEWIFTGEHGGFTIRVSRDRVKTSQRYYDSFGFGDAAHPARHPEKIAIESDAAFAGPPLTITVRLDSRLALVVSINGQELIRQRCLLDVTRHQLSWSGIEGASSGRLLEPEIGANTVEVDPTRKYQTMLGFGGITTPTAYAQLSAEGKRRWWKIVKEYNLLLHREYPIGVRLNAEMDNWDRLGDATPHYYGDNFPNGEISDFDYLKEIRRVGGKVLFEFWGLPPWTRRADPEGVDAEAYARAMVRYCQVAREHTGAPPDIVGIQNEVPQTAETWHQMTLRLRAALDQAGFPGVKIHMRDDGRLASGIACARAFRASAPVWKAIDYAATHVYDYQKFFPDPDAFDPLLAQWREAVGDKPFLSTELSVNSSEFQARSYRLALSMGQLYHKNLVLANASALLYCWLLLNVEQPSYGWTRTLFVPDASHGFVPAASSYQARVFGAYSRRIRAGMVRVEARSANPDLLVSAFTGGDGSRALVILNRSLHSQRVRVGWSGKPFRFVEWASPYADNEIASAPTGSEIVIIPGAIATLSTEEL